MEAEMDNQIDAILGLGTNLGDREGFLKMAVEHLSNLGKVTRTSSLYETPAWGYEDSKSYLNQVVVLKTSLTPSLLFKEIKAIESAAGRVVSRVSDNYEARTLDIDILFFGDTILHSHDLIIPHPRLQLRKFVLVPLVEILPDFPHPELHRSAAQLLERCPDDSEIKKYS